MTLYQNSTTLGDMDLERALQYFGLNSKQASVYLALLELGRSSAPAISKKSGVKRPTTYVILQELRQKGLLIEIPKKSKTLFIAKSPQDLIDVRNEETRSIRAAMPEIMALYNAKSEKPKVRFYQGEKEVLDLYHKEIFQEKEIWFVSAIGSIPEQILKSIERHLPSIKKGEAVIREIQQDEPVSQNFRKQHEGEFYQIKTAPKNFRLPTDNALYGNKVAIFSYKADPLAVVIESEDVVTTYRSLFEMAWSSIP